MNRLIINTFNKLFIAFYVATGYLRHYLIQITLRRALTALVIFSVLVGLILNFEIQQNMTGNDFLNQAYDHQNANRNILAYASFEQALAEFNVEKNARGILVTTNILGDMDMERQNYNVALGNYDTALRFAQFLDYKQSQINLLKKHAEVKLKLDRVNAARAHYLDAVKIAQDNNLIEEQGILFTSIGKLERDIGNDRRARYAYRNALKAYGDNEGLKGQAALHWQMADLETSLENYDTALSSYHLARDIYRTKNNIYDEANIIKMIARAENKRGQIKKAQSFYNEAATLYASIGKQDDLNSLKNELNSIK